MNLITTDDLKLFITPNDLQSLTGGEIGLLDKAEALAAEEMKAYVAVRYDTGALFAAPFREPLKSLLIDIMLWHLHANISPDHIPELRKERYDAAMRWLEKLAGGEINPDFPVKTGTDGTPLRYGSGKKFNHYY